MHTIMNVKHYEPVTVKGKNKSDSGNNDRNSLYFEIMMLLILKRTAFVLDELFGLERNCNKY